MSRPAETLLRAIRLTRPWWPGFVSSLGLGALTGLLALAVPLLTKLLVDQVYPAQNAELMHFIVAAILLLGLSGAGMEAVRGYYLQHVGFQLSAAIRLLFFNHLQHLPATFFDSQPVGAATSRFADVERSLRSVNNAVQTLFMSGIFVLLVPLVLLVIQWQLALLALIGPALATLVTLASSRLLRDRWRLAADSAARVNAFQTEALANIRFFKAHALENLVHDRARQQAHEGLQSQLRAARLSQFVGGLVAGIRAVNSAALTWFAWVLILQEKISLGDYVAFMLYLGYLNRPAAQVTSLISDLQESVANLGRMFQYLDITPEQEPARALRPSPPARKTMDGGVIFRNVCFSYQTERAVLRDVSARFPANEVTAIVGPTGAGKSTLLKIVARMITPDRGEVVVGGAPTTSLTLQALRRNLAVVWQEPAILSGTLRENLTLGIHDVSEARIREVLQACELEELVAGLLSGLDTRIAEAGLTLSGGERQRVAIARALLRPAPIVLLDEATSNLDTLTETRLLRGIRSHLFNRTVLVVTHRQHVAELADQVCVIDKGQVVAFGPPHRVQNECAKYCLTLAASPPARVAESDPEVSVVAFAQGRRSLS